MTIHAIGLDNDRTLVRFIERAVSLGNDVRFINLRAVTEQPWSVTLNPVKFGAILHGPRNLEYVLPPDGSYYVRAVDLSPVLPVSVGNNWRHLTGALTSFLDSIPGRVVNSPGAQCHNGSKPLHELWLSRHGFLVPPTLTSSDADKIRQFISRYGPCIVKSVCGARGTAQLVGIPEFAAFDPDSGPVHLQQRVEGFDVRVHLVGEEQFAERIDSDAVDYRDACADPKYTPTAVPPDLVDMMRLAAREMGLVFTGWDFRVDRDGRWWCLEVNPMPGFDVYDRRCDGGISAAICRVLRP